MKHRRLTISLDSQAYARLQTLAREEDRSLSWLIGQAVKEFLTRHAVAEQLEIRLPTGEGEV